MMVMSGVRSSWARTTGLVYLMYFLTAIAGQVQLSNRFAVLGKATNFVSVALYIVLGILFYRLFRPSGKILSLTAALFNFAGSAMMLVALFRGGNAPANPLLFFGAYCLLIGALVLRSGFLPRALGLLILAAGIGWFVFLAPLHTRYLVVSIEVLGFVAEAALMLWLLVRGVNEQRWVEQAGGH
jgi:hypothetical protein